MRHWEAADLAQHRRAGGACTDTKQPAEELTMHDLTSFHARTAQRPRPPSLHAVQHHWPHKCVKEMQHKRRIMQPEVMAAVVQGKCGSLSGGGSVGGGGCELLGAVKVDT